MSWYKKAQESNYHQLVQQLRTSTVPWERSGADRLNVLLNYHTQRKQPEPFILEEIRRQYARTPQQLATELGKAIDALLKPMEALSPPKLED